MPQEKKKHHFLPVMYLKGFCNSLGKIWVYQKVNPKEPPVPQTPKRTAFVEYFYAIEREDGTKDTNTFENALADFVETPAGNALKKIRTGQVLSEDDRQYLSIFLGFILVRTPSYREQLKLQVSKEFGTLLKNTALSKNDFAQWCEKYNCIYGSPIATNREEFRQEILSGVYKLSASPNVDLYMISKLGFSVALARV